MKTYRIKTGQLYDTVISVADPDPGSSAFWPMDPGSGMEKSGSGINISDHISKSFVTILWVETL
jgi:hypothetical protein